MLVLAQPFPEEADEQAERDAEEDHHEKRHLHDWADAREICERLGLQSRTQALSGLWLISGSWFGSAGSEGRRASWASQSRGPPLTHHRQTPKTKSEANAGFMLLSPQDGLCPRCMLVPQPWQGNSLLELYLDRAVLDGRDLAEVDLLGKSVDIGHGRQIDRHLVARPARSHRMAGAVGHSS